MASKTGTFSFTLATKALWLVSPDGSKNFYLTVNNNGNVVVDTINFDRSLVPNISNDGWISSLPIKQSTAYTTLQVEFDGMIGTSPTPTIESSPSTTITNISITGTNNNILQFDWNTTGAGSTPVLLFTFASHDQGLTKTRFLNVALDASPSVITSGLISWHDASDSGTITLSVSNVTQWNDKSPTSANLTQGTGSLQPLIIPANQNGLDVVRFDGVDDFMSSSFGTFSTLNAFTFFALVKSSTNGFPFSFGATGINYTTTTLNSTISGTTNTSTLATTPNTWQVCAITWNRTKAPGNVLDYYLGNSKGLQNLSYTSPVTETILYFGNYNNASSFFNGDIAEIIVYNRELRDLELYNIINYLKSKWNV